MILYTDGLTEAGRDIVRGMASLQRAAEELHERRLAFVPEALVERLQATGANDDLAVLAVEFHRGSRAAATPQTSPEA